MGQVAVKPLVIHIRAELKDKLRAIATKRDISMTKLVEELIVNFTSQDEEGTQQNKEKRRSKKKLEPEG